MEDSQSPTLTLHLCPPCLDPDKPHHSDLRSYVARLEHELKKIESFKRELPLSFLLITDAVGRLKKEGKELPLAANCDSDGDKKTWMSSAQLWSFDRKTMETEEEDGEGCKYNENGGVLSSFRDDVVVAGPGLSLPVRSEPATGRVGGRFTSVPVLADRIKLLSPPLVSSALQGAKKERRCWSPELHRRFVDALDKLGGYQVATPKQIRELMQVNDVTNDEVKSHLQKYRLHIRKVPSLSKDKLFVGYGPQPKLCGDGGVSSLKTETSQSGSPQGPLHLPMRSANCNSATSRFDGIEDVDEQKSNGRGWEDH